MNRTLVLISILGLAAAACSGSSSSEENNGASNNGASNNGASNNGTSNNGASNNVVEEVPEGALTYWGDLRPVMDTHCNTCHNGGGIAPFDWTDPDQVLSLSDLIRSAVEGRVMPPWAPADDCAPVQGDLRLSDEKIALFGQWIDDGKWMGDEADYVAGNPINPDIGSDRLASDETLEIFPVEAYPVPTNLSDDFRCFTMDPGFETDRYMTGFEVLVDNVAVAHHMVLFAVGPSAENDAALAALEAEDAEPGFSCFGSPGVDDLQVAGAWAPGGGVVGFPQATALKLEAGTKLVMQMHYNVAAGGGEDQTGTRIWLMPEDREPAVDGNLVFVGNAPFEIPPGVDGSAVPEEDCDLVYSLVDDTIPAPARGHDSSAVRADPSLVGGNGCVIQEFYYRNEVPLRIHSVFPHMHLKGTDIKVEIMPFEEQDGVAVPTEASKECTMDVPQWDFNWQRAYWLESSIRAPEDGVVRLVCRFDNSDSTDPVRLGDGSGDEMCLALFYLSI